MLTLTLDCFDSSGVACCLLSGILKFFHHILPALVTVGLGAFVVQKFFTSRANEASLIDLLVERLDSIQSDSIEYWTLPTGSGDENRKQQILAQKIKGSIKSIDSEIRFFCERYCPEKKDDVANLVAEISDACTGGSFETTDRQVEPSRYLFVVNSIHRLRSELFKRKL